MQLVFLVRHGAPDRSFSGRYDIYPGPCLSPEGQAQAARTAQFLAEQGVGRLFHSPLVRTLETAAIIANEVGKPSQQVEAIREKAREEAAADVQERVTDFWHKHVADEDETIALVSHGAPIDQLLRYLSADTLDLSQHRYQGGAGTPHAGIWQAVRHNGDDVWDLSLVFNPDGEGAGNN